MFSLGSRFDSDVRSKDHLKPKKKDGPGPGQYELPGSIRVGKQLKNPTFGKAGREWSDLPKDTPAPNQYKNIIKYTETSYAFSIPKGDRHENPAKFKCAPGPQHYEIDRSLKGGLGKTFCLGAEKMKKDEGNGVPGPGSYDQRDLKRPPGFRIVPPQNGKNE